MKSDAPLSSKENLSVSIRIKPASDTVQKRWQLDKEQNDVICGFDAAGEPIRGQMYKFGASVTCCIAFLCSGN